MPGIGIKPGKCLGITDHFCRSVTSNALTFLIPQGNDALLVDGIQQDRHVFQDIAPVGFAGFEGEVGLLAFQFRAGAGGKDAEQGNGGVQILNGLTVYSTQISPSTCPSEFWRATPI